MAMPQKSLPTREKRIFLLVVLKTGRDSINTVFTLSNLVGLRHKALHYRLWDDFWKQSFIRVSGSREAEVVSQGYALQCFITACAGRGAFPIKFNGSIEEHFWEREV